jgi:hypothetical protein
LSRSILKNLSHCFDFLILSHILTQNDRYLDLHQVESREAIMPRPSHLDLDMLLSPHPAPDILSLCFCLCWVQICMVRVLLQLYLCYSYARNHDKIHVLLLGSFYPNYRGFHPHDADVPFLRQ